MSGESLDDAAEVAVERPHEALKIPTGFGVGKRQNKASPPATELAMYGIVEAGYQTQR